jgi:triphosphoribosyl-dephospho-CoA synthetase
MDANEVLDGWHHEDAKQVLDAVKHAADGLITEGEMIAKLKDASGAKAFEQHVG